MTMKQMSATELRDEGYLQEVNRLFFHPLGLAMYVDAAAGTMGVYDDREDPEGWFFGPGPDDAPDHLVAKAQMVSARHDERAPARMAALGYWVQPTMPAVALIDEVDDDDGCAFFDPWPCEACPDGAPCIRGFHTGGAAEDGD